MQVFFNILITIIEQGLIYGIVALGVYISYKILDFPDLSVDGTFPLGGAVATVLILAGCPALIAMLVAMLAGCAAGCITGLLHVKLKISGLLSGILVMTALLTVNYWIGGRFLGFSDAATVFNAGLAALFPPFTIGAIVVLLLFVIGAKLLLDLFLKTKAGFLLRATGDNPQLVTSIGKNNGNYKILGLALANGLVALGGSLYSQYVGYYDYDSGTGTVVIALASVIIGFSIFSKLKRMRGSTMVIIGALLYNICLVAAMNMGFSSIELRLIMAALFTIVLVFNGGTFKRKVKKTLLKGDDSHVGT